MYDTRRRDKNETTSQRSQYVRQTTHTRKKSGIPRVTDTLLREWGKRKNTRGPARATRGVLRASTRLWKKKWKDRGSSGEVELATCPTLGE